MKIYLSVAILRTLWPHASLAVVQGVSATSSLVFSQYGFDSDKLNNLVDFIAECSEETGGMIAFTEDFHYTAERLMEVWPALFRTAAEAKPYVMNPAALVEKVYGGRYGNPPGKAIMYQGRGMIGITFLDIYKQVSEYIKNVTGKDLDLVNRPDRVNDPQFMLECAVAYWMANKVDLLADAGNFTAEVRKINGGLTNMKTRLAWRAICTRHLTEKIVTVSIPAAPVPEPAAAVLPSGKELHPGFLKDLEQACIRWLGW